jgi:hypothetical protein
MYATFTFDLAFCRDLFDFQIGMQDCFFKIFLIQIDYKLGENIKFSVASKDSEAKLLSVESKNDSEAKLLSVNSEKDFDVLFEANTKGIEEFNNFISVNSKKKGFDEESIESMRLSLVDFKEGDYGSSVISDSEYGSQYSRKSGDDETSSNNEINSCKKENTPLSEEKDQFFDENMLLSESEKTRSTNKEIDQCRGDRFLEQISLPEGNAQFLDENMLLSEEDEKNLQRLAGFSLACPTEEMDDHDVTSNNSTDNETGSLFCSRSKNDDDVISNNSTDDECPSSKDDHDVTRNNSTDNEIGSLLEIREMENFYNFQDDVASTPQIRNS